MVLNTTNGPVEVPKGSREPVINTSRVVEEDMQYLDEEPEILDVLPGAGWCARMTDGSAVPLVSFVSMETGKMYGVAVGEDGRIDLLHNSVEKNSGFVRYEQVNSNDKENK
jgi:hypothetical protein